MQLIVAISEYSSTYWPLLVSICHDRGIAPQEILYLAQGLFLDIRNNITPHHCCNISRSPTEGPLACPCKMGSQQGRGAGCVCEDTRPCQPKSEGHSAHQEGCSVACACGCSCGLQAQLWQHADVLSSPHAAHIHSHLAAEGGALRCLCSTKCLLHGERSLETL